MKTQSCTNKNTSKGLCNDEKNRIMYDNKNPNIKSVTDFIKIEDFANFCHEYLKNCRTLVQLSF